MYTWELHTQTACEVTDVTSSRVLVNHTRYWLLQKLDGWMRSIQVDGSLFIFKRTETSTWKQTALLNTLIISLHAQDQLYHSTDISLIDNRDDDKHMSAIADTVKHNWCITATPSHHVDNNYSTIMILRRNQKNWWESEQRQCAWRCHAVGKKIVISNHQLQHTDKHR